MTLRIITLFVALVSAQVSLASALADGSSRFTKHDDTTLITIYGPAADALYDDLSEREGSVTLPCNAGMSVEFDAFMCLRSYNATTRCMTNILPGKTKFSFPGFCKEPSHSVIGVGNPPAVREGKGTKGGKPKLEVGGVE